MSAFLLDDGVNTSAEAVCRALKGCRLTMIHDNDIEVCQDPDGTWYIQAIYQEEEKPGVPHSTQPPWPVSSGTPLIDLQNLLGDIWLYSNWAYVTRQLTTPQKELWLGAVAAWHKRLGPGEEFDTDEWAWWRK